MSEKSPNPWFLGNDAPLHVLKVKYSASMLSNNLVYTPSLIAYAHRSYPLTIPLLLPNDRAPDIHLPVSKVSSCGKEDGSSISQIASGRLHNVDVLVVAYENGVVNVVEAGSLLSLTHVTVPLSEKEPSAIAPYVTAMAIHSPSNTLFIAVSTGIVYGLVVTLRNNSMTNAKMAVHRLCCMPASLERVDGIRTWAAVTSMHTQGSFLALGCDDGAVILYQIESFGAAVTEYSRVHPAPVLPEWTPYHVFVRPPLLRVAGAGAEAVNGETVALPMPGLRPGGPQPLRWQTTSAFDSRAFLCTGVLHPLPKDISYDYPGVQDVAETKVAVPFSGQEFEVVCVRATHHIYAGHPFPSFNSLTSLFSFSLPYSHTTTLTQAVR